MLRHSETMKHYFLSPDSFAIRLFLLLQKIGKKLTTEYFRQKKYTEQNPSSNQETHYKSYIK